MLYILMLCHSRKYACRQGDIYPLYTCYCIAALTIRTTGTKPLGAPAFLCGSCFQTQVAPPRCIAVRSTRLCLSAISPSQLALLPTN